MAARRLAWDRLARSLLSCVSSSRRSNSRWPEPFPGQHFRDHHPVDLRPRDPGHLFPPPKPVAGSSGRSPSARAGHAVMPHGMPWDDDLGAGLVLVQAYVAFLRLELRFYTPTGSRTRMPASPRGILRSIGQVVAGFAAVQVPAVDGPVDFAGLPLLLVGRTRWR